MAREFLNYREIWLWILALTHPGHDCRHVALSSFCIYFPHLEEGFFCLMAKSRKIPWLKASSIPQTFSNHWFPSLLQTIVLVIHRWLTYSVSKMICLFCSSCQSQEGLFKGQPVRRMELYYIWKGITNVRQSRMSWWIIPTHQRSKNIYYLEIF